MTVEEIREALHKYPFEPFTLKLADGTERYVPHRDFVGLGRRRVTVFDQRTDALSILEPLLIVSIEYPGKKPRSTRSKNNNGGKE